MTLHKRNNKICCFRIAKNTARDLARKLIKKYKFEVSGTYRDNPLYDNCHNFISFYVSENRREVWCWDGESENDHTTLEIIEDLQSEDQLITELVSTALDI